MYGFLTPTAQKLWGWLQSTGAVELTKSLSLSEDAKRTLAANLELLDLSYQDIVYDDLGDDICSEENSSSGSNVGTSRPRLIRDVVSYLRHMKGTYKRIDLSNNLLSDEGLLILVSELKGHDCLEEIDLRKNEISDIGLRGAQDLMKLPKLRRIHLSGNYGPSEETIVVLVSWAEEDKQAALRAKIGQ